LRRAEILFSCSPRERMISLIDDELCDAIAVSGPLDEVKERLRAWDGVADRLLVAGPWYGVDPGRMLENYQALVETFGRASSGA
jgi:hypothetical protein